MHYLWWYVPYLTAPMLIAGIAVLHVLVSHYAVGGGLFLAVETGYAYRTGNGAYLNYLRRHSAFFVLLTVAFGAITGVGIWWTIGLSSPLATEFLIRTFVFGWATEWVLFVVEILSAFIFLYYWDRLPAKTHTAVGWIYAIAAWLSLVLITGITAFMLNSGNWAKDPGFQNFWSAFFNPQFLPQTIVRTGGALLLSSLYVYLHASLTVGEEQLRTIIARRASRPAFLGVVMVILGGLGWFLSLPDLSRAALASAAVLNLMMALIIALTLLLTALLYVGPFRNPAWLSPGFAGTLLLFGLAAVGLGEFVREAVRKPYVVHNIVLGNQVFAEEVALLREDGFLQNGLWTYAWLAEKWPELIVDGRVVYQSLLKLPPKDRLLVGRAIFLHHCNDCHAAELGYSAVGPLLQGRSREMVRLRVEHLDEHYSMPPWSGTPEELELLTDYLMTIKQPLPAALRVWRHSGSEEVDLR